MVFSGKRPVSPFDDIRGRFLMDFEDSVIIFHGLDLPFCTRQMYSKLRGLPRSLDEAVCLGAYTSRAGQKNKRTRATCMHVQILLNHQAEDQWSPGLTIIARNFRSRPDAISTSNV